MGVVCSALVVHVVVVGVAGVFYRRVADVHRFGLSLYGHHFPHHFSSACRLLLQYLSSVVCGLMSAIDVPSSAHLEVPLAV